MYLRQDLGVSEVHLGDGVLWAFGDACAASVAAGGDYAGGFAFFPSDGSVGALANAHSATLAFRFINY